MDKVIKNEDIKLPEGLLEKEFYICCVQLKTPFWDEVNKNQRGFHKYIGWESESLKKRKEKIETLLKEIKNKFIAKDRPIKILVFPEYAVEEGMIEILKEFVKSEQTIVVASMYEENERQSIAYIFIPDHEEIKIYKQYKLSKSRFDEEYLSDVPRENEKFYRFLWQPDKNQRENFMHVFVCHDFIKSACENVDTTRGGLIIVPMDSPQIDAFCGLSSYFVRRAEDYSSIVSLLCNATDDITSKDKETSCGETQICGPYEGRHQIKIERLIEGGFVAKINLNTVLTKPTRIERNGVITDLIRFSINESGYLKETEIFTSKLHTYMIDPNVLLHPIGLHKIYTFYSVKNYHAFMQIGKKLPFQSHGVFGIYDILIQGYEEELNCFERRLNSYLGEKHNELEDSDLPRQKPYLVTHVLKYRGKELIDISDGKFVPRFNFDNEEINYIESNLKNVRKVLIGKNIPENLEVEFENKGIIFKVEGESDILPHEQGRYDEYLVFVDIYPSWGKEIRDVMKEFQNSILPGLIKEDKIRTIEFCGKPGFDNEYPSGNYILHVVGNLNDVKQIILHKIHDISYQRDIRCRTFVVPIAEPISKEKYISLEETILRHPQLRERVYKIIYHLKSVAPTNPFIIKYLPHDTIEKIADFYTQYRKNTLKEKDLGIAEEGSPGETLKNLIQYIYGFCWGFLLDQNLDKEIFEKLKDYCSSTYSSSIFGKIETFLSKKRTEILNILSELPEETKIKYEDILKNTMVTRDKSAYTILRDSKQSLLGDLQGAIIAWNKNVILDHKIENEEFIEDIKKLKNPIKYRNYFIHSFKEDEMEKIKTTEFVEELFEHTKTSFDFVLKYCKDG